MSFLDDLGGFINDSESSIVDIAKGVSGAVRGTPTVPVPPAKAPTARPDLSTVGQTSAQKTPWTMILLLGAAVILGTALIFTRRG